MKGTSIKIPVSDSIGKVSGEIMQPEKMKAMLVLAHGAGAGMNHPFMTGLSKELAALEIGTLRFNFPFTEQKKKRPDVPAVAHKTIEAVIQKAQELFSPIPIFAGGKSFGGRMTSQLFSKMDIKEVKGIVFVGFPLHAPGNPSIDRAEHLQTVKKKMLFLQGTRDTLAQWDLIEQVTSSLTMARLVKLEGADHGFKMGKLNAIPILAQHINTWMGLK
ncbi:MAG TPA: alpha/beta family hydrolase [Cyclobacteriaceae bacterium]|nr:alpha/beta family hydrolase [Cyclobacteriaceae bacterium]